MKTNTVYVGEKNNAYGTELMLKDIRKTYPFEKNSFDVKTKGKLQKIPDYLYSNYQVKVTANLISSDENDRNYQATSWIVYTNAKVNAQYVSAAN